MRHRGHTRASMRPRVIPAEDNKQGSEEGFTLEASMRPRVIPAEDSMAVPEDELENDLLQ